MLHLFGYHVARPPLRHSLAIAMYFYVSDVIPQYSRPKSRADVVQELLDGELGATPAGSRALSPGEYYAGNDVDDASLIDEEDVSWLLRARQRPGGIPSVSSL